MNIEGGITHKHPQVSRLRGQNQYLSCVKNLKVGNILEICSKPKPLVLKGESGVARGDKLGIAPPPPL